MFCPQCGKENKDDAKFCTGCGNSLQVAKAALNKAEAAGDATEQPEGPQPGEAEKPIDAEQGDTADVSEGPEPSNNAKAEETKKGDAEKDEVAQNSAQPGESEKQSEAEQAARTQGATEPVDGKQPAYAEQASQSKTQDAAAADTEPAAQPKKHTLAYVAGIAVGLVAIGFLAFQLFGNRTGGDLATYGQVEPIYIDADTQLTPQDADSKELDSYTVTLTGSKGTAASAKISGSKSFSLKTAKKLSKVTSGSYTLTVKSSTTKVEWSLPVKFAPKSKKVSAAVTLAPASTSDSSKGTDSTDSSSSTTASAYALYYQKCQEYIATYGEGSVSEVSYKSAFGTSSERVLFGLACVKLVDFDNDGTEELYLVYNTSGPASFGQLGSSQSGAFVSEVWAYRDGGIKRLYKGEGAYYDDAGFAYTALHQRDNVYALETTRQASDQVITEFKELSGDSFKTKHSWGATGNGIEAKTYVDGKLSDLSALSSLLAEYSSTMDTVVESSFGSESFGNVDTTLQNTQQTIASLKSARDSAASKSAGAAKSGKNAKAENKKLNKKAHAAYDEVLSQYRKAFADDVSALVSSGTTYNGKGDATYWTDAQKSSKYPLVSYYAIINKGMTADSTQYCYKDLNGDGVDELLIGVSQEDGENVAYAVYGYIDGKVKGLLAADAAKTSSLTAREDGTVCLYANDGWALNSWTYFQFDGKTMSKAESVEQQPGANQVTTVHSKNGETVEQVTDSNTGDASALTNSNELISKVASDHPVDGSLSWSAL